MLILYHLVGTLIFIIFFPVFYLLKNRDRFKERFGLNLPHLNQPAAGRLWVHALSVGEVLSAVPLVQALKRKYPSKEMVLSVTTTTGLSIAREKLSGHVDHLLPMPLDFWWSVRRIIKNINPILFILVETDIWPGLLSLLKKSGVKTILVNGRISPKSEESYRRWKFVTKRVLRMVELFLMQTELDKSRIMRGGPCPDKVKVTGNIKFDRAWKPLDDKERHKWLELLNLSSQLIWVAGSTHHPEEKIILNVFSKLLRSFPTISLIIGPREADRFDVVYNLARDHGFRAIKRTQLSVQGTSPVSSTKQTKALYKEKENYNVFILDTIGELGRIYGIADIAFVGGSLAPVGGHNLLEPAFFGIPVLFGPYTYNFSAMSELMIKHKAGKMVVDESELFGVMRGLLSQKSKRDEIGKRAKEFVLQNQGALDRIMEILKPYIEVSKVPQGRNQATLNNQK